jgi:exopolysaccharide biosynthesis polyprenyl glycosylphosphotransferase
MLKELSKLFTYMVRLADMGCVALAFFLTYDLRNTFKTLYPLHTYLWVLPVLLVLWKFSLQAMGMYQSTRIRKTADSLQVLLRAAAMVFLIFGSINYVFRVTYLSRSLIIFNFVATISLIGLEKLILAYSLKHLRRQGRNFRNTLVVGTGERAAELIEQIRQQPELGLNIVGVVDNQEERQQSSFLGHTVIGGLPDLENLLHVWSPDYVFFVLPKTQLDEIEPAVRCCETLGITAGVAIDLLYSLEFTPPRIEMIFGLPMVTYQATSTAADKLLLKRGLDILLSSLALVLLSPLFLLLILIVKLTSPGPAFFKQERCTLNGRRFSIYKFRTMMVGAESRLKDLMAFNEMQGPVFKMEKDPRLTPVGGLLRKLSLDELPQFWNVLKGDMSLVGPRPPLPLEVEKYTLWQRRKLSMWAGLTCLWQVQGRSKITDFNEWTKLDLNYIDNWSLGLDFKILLKTVKTVLLRVGAK